MKGLMIVLILIITTNCSQDGDKDGPFIKDNGVTLTFTNKNGEDLLNPKTPNHFNFEEMRLYYLIDGVKTEVYDPLMDHPRGLGLVTETTPCRLSIGTYDGLEGAVNTDEEGITTGYSFAYLEINNQMVDTIKTKWITNGFYFYNTETWYNGTLISDGPQGTQPFDIGK